MDAIAQRRLKWKCRRGLLELDLVLDRFLQREPLPEEDLPHLQALLDLPDNDLWDIVIGRSNDYDSRLSHIVARLRAT